MKIDITLTDNRGAICKDMIIGKTFENNATTLCFKLTPNMADKLFYLEFQKPDGTKFVSEKLDITKTLLDQQGSLRTEVVLIDEEGYVWKSYTLKFSILESINASEELPETHPDFVLQAQKVIDLIETDGEGNKFLSNDGTYKEVDSSGIKINYSEAENKPSINNVELDGNKTLEELGIQEKGDYASKEEIPAKTSELENDSNFITKEVADLMNYYDKNYVDNIPKIESLVGTAENPINVGELNNGIYHLEGKIRYSSKFTQTYDVGYSGIYLVTKLDEYKVVSIIMLSNYSSGTTDNIYMNVTNIDQNNNRNGRNYDFSYFLNKINNASISAKYTFTTLPESSKEPTTNNQLVNKLYVDSNAGGHDIIVLKSNGTSTEPLIFEPEKMYYVGRDTQGIIYFRSSKEPEDVVHSINIDMRGLLSITDGVTYTSYQMNIINGIYLCYANIVNGTSSNATLTKKSVSTLASVDNIPTKTSKLTNDSGFITNEVADLTNYYNKEYIDNMSAGLNALPVINVEDLEKSGTRYIIDDNIKPFTLITVNSYAELILVGTTSGNISLSQGLYMIWYDSNTKPSTSGFGSEIHIKLISRTNANNSQIVDDYILYKSGTTTQKTNYTFMYGDYATKDYTKTAPKTYTGYDATKTQVLKNINGVLTWVDE